MAEQPDELTITLRKPVEHSGTTYEKLDLREPTADELMQIDKLDGREADVLAISLIAGVPKGAVGKIGARDLIAGANFLAGFLSAVPQTGAAS